IREALSESLQRVVDAVKETLERTPPELSADIIDQGIMLSGGGAMLKGLDQLITQETGIDTHVAENALDCVALGSGSVLDNIALLGDVLNENSTHF
ncbi:MAG: rod shape-determining protein, partial [Oscillospiraceae bacterium]|nr:rod shape-determining protein [Oscillospiraceae bacterium]